MNRTTRRLAAWTGRIVLTVIVTYFLFRSLHVSWSELSAVDLTLWRPRLLPLAASIAALLAVFAYLVWLWARLVQKLGGPKLGLGEAIRIFFLANLGRYVPGKVWQLAGLAYLSGRRGVNAPVATSAAVLGQLCGLGAAALVAAAGVTVAGASEFPTELVPLAAILGALIVLLVVVPPVLNRALRLAFRLGKRGGATPDLDRWFGARWLGLYVPGWVGYGLAFGLLWSAFPGLPSVAWKLAIGSFAGAYFLGYIAVFAPAGVGVREGVLALLLTPSLGAPSAAVVAIIARLWMTLAEVIPLVWVGVARLLGSSNRGTETTGHGG